MTLLDMIAPYFAGTAAGLFVFYVYKRQSARGSLPLPPGPKPLPVIGNLLDIPKDNEWQTFQAWNERYGDVVCVDALGKKIIILGSADAVDELMERRGSIYSDRPNLVMINELYVSFFIFMMMTLSNMKPAKNGPQLAAPISALRRNLASRPQAFARPRPSRCLAQVPPGSA
jgi:hypothetical protein